MTTWLVGHDFSPSARTAALEAARDLDALGGGRLILLHAWRAPHAPQGFDLAAYRDAIEIDANYQLTQMADELRAHFDRVEVATMLREDAPEDAVLEVADEEGCSRIIVGTHSRSEIEAEFLGSVAQRIMRRAAVPVLVVKAARALPPA